MSTQRLTRHPATHLITGLTVEAPSVMVQTRVQDHQLLRFHGAAFLKTPQPALKENSTVPQKTSFKARQVVQEISHFTLSSSNDI